jgi:hypothetical protein
MAVAGAGRIVQKVSSVACWRKVRDVLDDPHA